MQQKLYTDGCFPTLLKLGMYSFSLYVLTFCFGCRYFSLYFNFSSIWLNILHLLQVICCSCTYGKFRTSWLISPLKLSPLVSLFVHLIILFCSNIASSENILYTDQDIEASMERIETVDFHAVRNSCNYGYSCLILSEVVLPL